LNLYERLLRPLLFRLDPERAHRLTIVTLARMPSLRWKSDPSVLGTTVLGLEFGNPIGLAAGLDKDARAVAAWSTIGFGFAELGTITPRPQSGNPAPRMWRLPEYHALINRLGFPSDGMDVVASRVERARRRGGAIRLGLNFGPNRETLPESVPGDYSELVAKMGHLADFIVVNLSSPNTPGLREFQAPERMRTIVEAIRVAPIRGDHRPPLLVKLAPDLEPLMLREVCAAARELALDGIVATNTTIRREEVGVRSALAGGLSGEPIRERAREIIAHIWRDTGGTLPIIGVGGIASGADAYGHIRAGASLVELYTGFVYRGPQIVRMIKAELASLLIRDGFRSISEATGADA
jgi:dihydroorotate dehydrogenase